ncbi:PASTA domain-containing protein [Rhodococcus aetherivorans]|uniref:PASTA domain-containing protein n=1 Tax=Rhodococcus aetherivorans TaxID=191292 RepID=UPI001E5031AD|nr:PASTA domain-containing protein [Rhodococcus aetherivorans]UGQ41875.1 PASTA domain-containing protein [Rhodococcus aetherivorans]
MFAVIFLWLAFLYVIYGDVAGFFFMLVVGCGLGYLAVGRLIRDRRARTKAESEALAARAEAGHRAFLAGDPAAFALPPEPTPRQPVRRGVVVAAAGAALFVIFGIITDIQNGLEDPNEPDSTTTSAPPTSASSSRTAETTAPTRMSSTAAPTTSSTTLSAPTTTTDVAAAEATPTAVMPYVRCMDLQAAQDTIQSAGVFYSRSVDATGQGRTQIVDRNWVVVAQSPAPGAIVGEGDAVLSVVKEGERGDCS